MPLVNPIPNEMLQDISLDAKKPKTPKWIYSGGEVGVRVEPDAWTNSGMYRIQNANDILALIMGINANQQHNKDLDAIFIPYMPYARQDRVATLGDPNAIQAFAKLLKTNTNIDVIYTLDIHSEKAAQAFVQTGFYLNTLKPTFFIEKYIQLIAPNQKVVLVSPDKGAKNKTHTYATEIDNVVGVVYCEKERDPVSGRLSRARVDSYDVKTVLTKEEVKESNIPLVIVDDICDGGRTFVNVVDALRYDGFQNEVHLWTTHAIYSAGLDDLKQKFVSLGSTDSFIHGLVDSILHTIPLNTP